MTACCRGCTQSGTVDGINVNSRGHRDNNDRLMNGARFIELIIMITMIARTVMKFGTSCKKTSGGDDNCLSHWNMSAFHIAISHSINPNEMSVWMEVVQALTQYPVIDWFGWHGSMHMQRACFAKLIVGQSAALHLYNDHRLTGPTSYPHPEFGIAG
jgi:hypothetical protein